MIKFYLENNLYFNVYEVILYIFVEEKIKKNFFFYFMLIDMVVFGILGWIFFYVCEVVNMVLDLVDECIVFEIFYFFE